jgi:pseudouridine synthase
MERLQRVLAARGVSSRRRSEDLIRAGRVSVNGDVITQLGTKVDPQTAEIRVDGKLVRPQVLRYILLNKPRGYITTTSDERDRATVMDLVPARDRVYPVGRLDRDTEGLLLLTNDGEVANRVMHPRYGMTKEYHVLTFSRPSPDVFRQISRGVAIDGKSVVPDEFRILRETPEGLILKIVVHEGMNRIVRRMMEAVGIPVERLRRVRIGPLSVAGISTGSWRELSAGERANLFEALRLSPPEPAHSDMTARGTTRKSTPKPHSRARTDGAP